MNVYIAAPWERKDAAREIRKILQEAGHECTATWIDDPGGDPLAEARQDIVDIIQSQVLVAYKPDPDPSNGGRDTEMGMALAWGREIHFIGEPKNVFLNLLGIKKFKTIDDWRDAILGGESAANQPDGGLEGECDSQA